MQNRLHQACELMAAFAERTGLTSQRPPQRYLWTDAFAVCNWLGLSRATGAAGHAELALQMIDAVHHVLARHRADDRRTGWLSGLSGEEAEAHPTRAGLRIGKPWPERTAAEPVDERLEWERDGQYFHYLTKWMHALNQASRASGQTLFTRWASELAITAHRAFTYTSGAGTRRMYWKLSIDLSRPLVASMGQHDPLDGLVTCLQLQATANGSAESLDAAIADFAGMIAPRALASADPLGIGGLLVDAYRLNQLHQHGTRDVGLIEPLLAAARAGLQHYVNQPDLQLPAPHRLAFRELGLAIGLATLERDDWSIATGTGGGLLRELARFSPLRGEIEAFWLRPDHRSADSWLAHANINDVMLATSLAPDGFILLHGVS